MVIDKAVRERRFAARAMRVDSTVVESDVRWPSDAALAGRATRRLAREGARKPGRAGSARKARVVDRSRAAGKRLRAIGRTVGRRHGRGRRRAGPQTHRPDRQAARSLDPRSPPAGRPAAPREARGAARRPSSPPPSGWSGRPSWPSPSSRRSRSGSPARRSPTGWSPWPTRTPARSARASSASATSSATSSARRAHPKHPSRRARADPAGRQPDRQRRMRTSCCPDRPELDRLGLQPREVALDGGFRPAHQPTPRRSRPSGCSSPAANSPARNAHRAAGPLPHRLRRPHQPPQTRLRTTALATQGPPGPADLDRLGDPRLQPRHPRRPHRLTASRTVARLERELAPETAAPPPRRGRFNSPPFIRGKCGRDGTVARGTLKRKYVCRSQPLPQRRSLAPGLFASDEALNPGDLPKARTRFERSIPSHISCKHCVGPPFEPGWV